jgi:beta-glucosidase
MRFPLYALQTCLTLASLGIPLPVAANPVPAVQELSVAETVAPADPSLWRNPDKPIAERVQALMSQLTMKEKFSLIYWKAPAIDRLGINAYDHGDEALHGLIRPGNNTVFPEAIGLGATFDPPLLQEMSTAISDEARARWNQGGGQHLGLNSDSLTLWSPVVNLARDPRWGRTQETYGEDPCLTAHMGVAFVHGLQGDDPNYIKVISTPKHFAANNEESGRFGKNITCDQRYLQEYELG